MSKLIYLACFIAVVYANQCTDSKLTNVQTYVSKDSKLHTETSYVVEFTLKCGNKAQVLNLYTEVNGNFIVSSVSSSGDKYQFSWIENHKTAKTGEIKIRVFDEDGYSELRKAQRNNEDSSKVKELSTIIFTAEKSFDLSFVKGELLVTLLFIALFYWASTQRSKITA